MSGEEIQKPRKKVFRSLRYPEACDMVSEYQELSCLAPSELRRYSGMR